MYNTPMASLTVWMTACRAMAVTYDYHEWIPLPLHEAALPVARSPLPRRPCGGDQINPRKRPRSRIGFV